MPLLTLAHEMGHAAVALRVSPGRVIVHVGRPATGFEVHFERLKVCWSPIPSRGVQFRGVCVWEGRTASARAWLAVSLAGPLVTASLIPILAWEQWSVLICRPGYRRPGGSAPSARSSRASSTLIQGPPTLRSGPPPNERGATGPKRSLPIGHGVPQDDLLTVTDDVNATSVTCSASSTVGETDLNSAAGGRPDC
jgi:hypothetical protein